MASHHRHHGFSSQSPWSLITIPVFKKKSGLQPEIGQLPDIWRRKDIVRLPKDRIVFGVGSSTGDWRTYPTLGGGGKILLARQRAGLFLESGLQPEIGELPDTWRRRKDIYT